MRIGAVRLSAVSVAVLAIQLVFVSLIAAKYLYQRATCPRVWTRTAVYDPDLFMRGRYLSLQLRVDGCAAAKTLGEHLLEQPNTFVTPVGVPNGQIAQFEAVLAVQDNKLIARRVPDRDFSLSAEYVSWRAGASCDAMTLQQPVNFYIAEHAESPLPVKQGDELWIEVTLPPKGPPRPIQLALKRQGGAWQPLTYR
ncbi:hypothetical protein [Terracidiphilus gabretensis]|uniref:hypothetical protein n=1 Tax=Terracidiphilus gabretensis TaxID=1577687 RepID=UPI00071B5E67|nr:hypothetical protein [Terracidiphilus gabretensis]